jgi:exodeoxyribonuclease VII small subunit
LDESLKIFEQGMNLAKFCTRKLDEAEQKIEVLIKKDGEFIKKDIELSE